MKIRLISTILLLFLSGAAHAAMYDPSVDWHTIKTKHFSIHFGKSLEPQANKVGEYLEDAYDKLTPALGWKPWGRTEVVITDNRDAANGLSSTLPYNWMLLFITAPDPDSVLGDYDNWLRTLCFHEYTHILHIDQYGGGATVPRIIFGKVVSPNGSVPGFIREGMSTYFETKETEAGRGRSSYADMMLRTAILNGKFLHIDEADGLQWKWPAYQSMYIYGVKFMTWLKDKYGEEKLMEFHRRMGRSLMLFAVNHQARHVFSDVQYESKKAGNRYVRVRKEGTPKSKTFYDLWREWKVEVTKEYMDQAAGIEAEGVTEFTDVAGGGTVLSSPAISPDGKYLAYSRARIKGPPELHLIDLTTGAKKLIKKRYSASAIAFSPDSKKFVFSKLGVYKTYNIFSELFTYDIEAKKIDQLTKGARASDPTYTPDGKSILFIRQDKGRSWLALYDIETKEIADISVNTGGRKAVDFSQFASPAVSPNGRWLAVSSWQLNEPKPGDTYEKGEWNMYLGELSKDKKSLLKVFQITSGKSIDTRPVFSPDSKSLYFSSDRDGVNNIYKVDIANVTGKKPAELEKVTNVTTGVFSPAISGDGTELYVQYYNGFGYDIRKAKLGRSYETKALPPIKLNKPVTFTEDVLGSVPEGGTPPGIVPEIGSAPTLTGKKYSPFGKSLFLPRFIIPTIATLDNAVMLSAFTGGTDVLRRHTWLGGINYRTDLLNYIGFFFNYGYNRFTPILGAGVMGYAVKFSQYNFINTDGSTYSKNLFEERLRGYGSFTYPYKKHAFGLTYFFENWESNFSSAELNALATAGSPISLGHYAGASITYTFGSTERFPSSISNEHGTILRTNFTITDNWLGASNGNEQRVFAGDCREYVNLPWANHVIAMRVGGGMVWGDEMNQGTFVMGGALGEGTFGGGSSLYYFPLRGLNLASLVGTRAMLMSGEYRVPLVSPQRGLGTTPFYIQNIYMAPFVDFGNAWYAQNATGSYFFNRWLLSAGAEIRADFIIGHGLPFTGRLGYGIVVWNRYRLGNVNDQFTKTPLKDGTLILQLGSAF